MYKNVEISTESRKTIGFSNKLIVFLICLIFSSVFWLITNLSTEYISNIEFEVTYKGFYKGLVLSKNPISKLEVKIKSSGFKLLLNRVLGVENAVSVDLEKIAISKDKKGRYFFKTNQIIGRNFEYSNNNLDDYIAYYGFDEKNITSKIEKLIN